MRKLCFVLFCGIQLGIVHSQKLQTVDSVDLSKYAGQWYEIASYPQRFQKGCTCTTADYTATQKDYLIVENRCHLDAISKDNSYIKGKVFAKKNSNNSKLKVQFFWPFKSKYWIIDLAQDYSYAVVSHPNRKYLWILSRTPEMNATTYQQITNRLRDKRFDLQKLEQTIQK